MNFHHVSVLRKETIDNLITDPDGIYVDCTLGGGGHSRALAERLSSKATLIGLDQDRDAIAAATERLKDTACRRILVQRNFRYLPDVLDELGIERWTASCSTSACPVISSIRRNGAFPTCRTVPWTCAWTGTRSAALTISSMATARPTYTASSRPTAKNGGLSALRPSSSRRGGKSPGTDRRTGPGHQEGHPGRCPKGRTPSGQADVPGHPYRSQ